MKRPATIVLAAAAIGLAACDYRPLYGTTDAGSPVAYQLASIAVAEQNTRLGQLIRNEIVSAISPAGTAPGDAYTLQLTASEDEFTSVDSTRTEPLRFQHKVKASFALYDNDTGKAIHSGKTFSQVSYDRVDAPAANLQAQINARERAAKEIGRDIRIRLAAYFSKNGGH